MECRWSSSADNKVVAKELADLFRSLQSSDKAVTKPSQRLANAVLLSTRTLLRSAKPATDTPAEPAEAPPLPARPTMAETAKTTEDVDMASVSVTSVPDNWEAASNSSTHTLVDQDDAKSDRSYEKVEVGVTGQSDGVTEVKLIDDTVMPEAEQATQVEEQQIGASVEETGQDVDMADANEPETVDQKVLNALEHQKRSSGTDQQDVEEVMGSIINRLQAAIRPSSIDEKTGIQLEKIMETFFVTTVNYTKKFDDKAYQNEISFDRSITAYPAPDGPCSLYEALGRNFDQQILEESKLSRYTAIKTLPPVLHVLIQRTQSMGSKNGNPVVIPETLYMDRYMDAPHDSPLFRRRVEDWAITNRIADLKSQLQRVDNNPNYLSYLQNYANGTPQAENETAGGNDVQEENGDAVEVVTAPEEETWEFDGPVEDEFLLVTSPDAPAQEQSIPREPLPAQEQKVLSIRETHEAIRDMMERELQQREETLKNHQEDMKEVPYRLHAVICHRGQLMSGHYWVWIRDFEANVWRWYNDADVKENKDTKEVLETLSTSGEPYYLCYVRDNDKSEFVDVPKRTPPTPPVEAADTPGVATTSTDLTPDSATDAKVMSDSQRTTATVDETLDGVDLGPDLLPTPPEPAQEMQEIK